MQEDCDVTYCGFDEGNKGQTKLVKVQIQRISFYISIASVLRMQSCAKIIFKFNLTLLC